MTSNAELTGGRFIIKVNWGALRNGAVQRPDLDLQALLFGYDGSVVDVVFYNKARSNDSAVVHTSGDEDGAATSGINGEEIVIDLDGLDHSICAVGLTLSSFHSSAPLASVTDIVVTLEHQPPGGSSAAAYHATRFAEFGSDGLVAVVGSLSQMGKRSFSISDRQLILAGQTFVEAAPSLRNLLGLPEPSPPTKQFCVPISLAKGQSMALHGDTNLDQRLSGSSQLLDAGVLVAGVGWDMNPAAEVDPDADVDLSALLLDDNLEILGRIFWGQLDAFDGAVKHSGDNPDGRDAGDDETIQVELGRLPRRVAHIVFFVNRYADVAGSGTGLADVRNLHFRLYVPGVRWEQDERTIARVEHLGLETEASGFATALLTRGTVSPSGERPQWRIAAMGDPVDGSSLLDPVATENLITVVRSTLTALARGPSSQVINYRDAFGARGRVPQCRQEDADSAMKKPTAQRHRAAPAPAPKRETTPAPLQQQQASSSWPAIMVALVLVAALVLNLGQ